jgi:hypothetical protein
LKEFKEFEEFKGEKGSQNSGDRRHGVRKKRLEGISFRDLRH